MTYSRFAAPGRVLVGCVCMLAVFSSAFSKPDSDRKVRIIPFTNERLQRAIDRGAKYLWTLQQDDGSFSERPVNRKRVTVSGSYAVGRTAICCYALLESGVSAKDERMKKSLNYLMETFSDRTYDIALRANVWLLAMRDDRDYRKFLEKDTEILYKSDNKGSYTYQSLYALKFAPKEVQEKWKRILEQQRKLGRNASYRWDNSNAQYGVLGVWAGVRGNIEVPTKYWEAVEAHWSATQADDGGWGYAKTGRSKPYPAMTAAGVATLFVCADNLYNDKFLRCNTGLEMQRIQDGIDWIEEHFAESMTRPKKRGKHVMVGGVYNINNYYLYGLERVGLASGYKYFGKHDWFRAGASYLLEMQEKNGHWPGGWADGQKLGATAYAMLFLIRGMQPVVFNRLQYSGDWNNRPRALANVCHWLTRKFERELNWQVINVKVPVGEWHDAPILVLTGSTKPEFTDEQLEKLRTFVHQGGTILSISECSGTAFRDGMRAIYRKLWPKYELTPCGDNHPIQNAHYALRGRTKLYELHNGVRPLAIHTDADLPRTWQQNRHKTATYQFETAANIAFYVVGKGGFRQRGENPWPKQESFKPAHTVKVLRLKHNAHADPEPLAWKRFAIRMGNRYRVKVDLAGPAEFSQLAKTEAKLAVLTGTGRLVLSDEQAEALATYVQAGGTVLIDAAGGDQAFARSARKQLARSVKGDRTKLLADGPILGREGMEIGKVHFRPGPGRSAVTRDRPDIKAIVVDGQPRVILSEKDLLAGLLGVTHADMQGVMPEDAFRIVRNVLLHAAGIDRLAEAK